MAVKSWVRKREVDKRNFFLFSALNFFKGGAKLIWGLPCRGGHSLELIPAAGGQGLGKQGGKGMCWYLKPGLDPP